MTAKQTESLRKLLQQAQSAVLDPSPRNPAKASKLLDRAIAKLEKADK